MFGKPVILTLLLIMVLSWTAAGDAITFELNYEFSGATPPVGSTPWLTVMIDDDGTPGSVRLTLENTNLVFFEYTNNWYLNIDPLLDPSELSFAELSRTGTFASPSISTSTDSYKAAGDGYYDILFDFEQSFGSRFGAGEVIEYEVTGIDTLTAYSFDAVSTFKGEDGIYNSAAHIGAIYPSFCDFIKSFWCSNDSSGWIANTNVPEPATISMLAIGGLITLLRRRRCS